MEGHLGRPPWIVLERVQIDFFDHIANSQSSTDPRLGLRVARDPATDAHSEPFLIPSKRRAERSVIACLHGFAQHTAVGIRRGHNLAGRDGLPRSSFFTTRVSALVSICHVRTSFSFLESQWIADRIVHGHTELAHEGSV
jgi:hypothetical protein